jgi:hypothetical protein
LVSNNLYVGDQFVFVAGVISMAPEIPSPKPRLHGNDNLSPHIYPAAAPAVGGPPTYAVFKTFKPALPAIGTYDPTPVTCPPPPP